MTLLIGILDDSEALRVRTDWLDGTAGDAVEIKRVERK
jgi:hypothetical protein